MKTVFLTVVLTLISVGAIVLAFKMISAPSSTYAPAPAALTPKVQKVYCTPQDLQALVNLSPGAGNVYGTFTLKNISAKPCNVLGGSYITVHFDTSIKNITVSHIGQTQIQPFVLNSGQTLYSQVHYPNGPQCQSVGLRSTPVNFTYTISSSNTVTFASDNQGINQVVQACTSPQDITDIQIWNMAVEPITP